ncbi:MAG: stage V sporulation protein AD, partial [Lachnospiraceae bacterium]|nr:stage V sporulation protein AD [Lachnospiraceae bacterium]
MIKRIGRHTIEFTEMPRIVGAAAVVGKKESEGPLAQWFDRTIIDTTMGGETWEKAEALFQKEAVTIATVKSGVKCENIDYIFAGDLLNQCISSS